jgi:hypothetical protein
MKSFLKHSIAAVLFGAMICAGLPIYAATVEKMENGNRVDVGGFFGVRFGMLTPYENPGSGEKPPTQLATASESHLVVGFGSDALYGQVANYHREDPGSYGWADYWLHQVTWKPMGGLRIDGGAALIYFPWSDRAIQWENFQAFRPIPNAAVAAAFRGFMEGNPGIDLTYSVADGIDVGVAVFTAPIIGPWGLGRFVRPDQSGSAHDPADGVATGPVGCPAENNGSCEGDPVGSTYAVHFVYAADTLKVNGAYFIENAEDSDDGWANSEEVSNSSLFVTAKYGYDSAGSFVKLEYGMAEFDSKIADETESVIALGADHTLGDGGVYLEFSTLSNINGSKDAAGWLQVGYHHNVAPGGRVFVGYEQGTNEPDVGDSTDANFIFVSLVQTF